MSLKVRKDFFEERSRSFVRYIIEDKDRNISVQTIDFALWHTRYTPITITVVDTVVFCSSLYVCQQVTDLNIYVYGGQLLTIVTVLGMKNIKIGYRCKDSEEIKKWEEELDAHTN